MSFAQGFAAGSAAVERGLNLKEKREKREREEAYQQGLADLNKKFTDSQQAQADYNASVPVQQGAVASGPITSAAGLNPMAQAGVAAPADPNVQRTVTDVAAAPTGIGATPTGMGGPTPYTFNDYRRDAAQLAIASGDQRTGLALMGQLQMEDRMDQQQRQFEDNYGLMRDRLDQQDEQFYATLDLKEDQLEQVKTFQKKQMEQMTAQINDLNFRLEEGQKDARLRDHQRVGEQEFNRLYFDPNFTVAQGVDNLRARFTNAEGVLDEEGFNQAQGAAAKMYYEDYLGVDAATAGMVQSSAVSKLDAAIARSKEPDLSDDDFINMFGAAIREHVDPNFSDNISTELVAIKNDDGENTGEFELRHGGQRVANAPRFSSRADVVKFAQAESDRLATSPFAVIEITENRKKSAAAAANYLDDYQDREKAYFEFMEANPHMMSRSLELKKMFRLQSGLSTDGTSFGGSGGGGNTNEDPAIAAINQRTTDEAAAATTASELENTALTIIDASRGDDDLTQLRALAAPDVQQEIDRILSSDAYPYRRRRENQGLGLGAAPLSIAIM
jgi:hypothetical protein